MPTKDNEIKQNKKNRSIDEKAVISFTTIDNITINITSDIVNLNAYYQYIKDTYKIKNSSFNSNNSYWKDKNNKSKTFNSNKEDNKAQPKNNEDRKPSERMLEAAKKMNIKDYETLSYTELWKAINERSNKSKGDK